MSNYIHVRVWDTSNHCRFTLEYHHIQQQALTLSLARAWYMCMKYSQEDTESERTTYTQPRHTRFVDQTGFGWKQLVFRFFDIYFFFAIPCTFTPYNRIPLQYICYWEMKYRVIFVANKRDESQNATHHAHLIQFCHTVTILVKIIRAEPLTCPWGFTTRWYVTHAINPVGLSVCLFVAQRQNWIQKKNNNNKRILVAQTHNPSPR